MPARWQVCAFWTAPTLWRGRTLGCYWQISGRTWSKSSSPTAATGRNGPFVDGMSAKFGSVNRGKRSIVLDLKHPTGKAGAAPRGRGGRSGAELRAGVMDRLGLGYRELSERNPRLIYASCTGFGEMAPTPGVLASTRSSRQCQAP